MMKTQDAPLELTREDLAFWIDYTETPIEEVAELAGISVGLADWMVGGPDTATRDLDAFEAVVAEVLASERTWTNGEAAARAADAGISLRRFWFMYSCDEAPTLEDYLRVSAVVGNLIDTKARAKMIAWGQEHGVPGFQ